MSDTMSDEGGEQRSGRTNTRKLRGEKKLHQVPSSDDVLDELAELPPEVRDVTWCINETGGTGRFQWRMIAYLGGVSAFLGQFAMSLVFIVESANKTGMEISKSDKSLIDFVMLFGWMFGAFISSLFSDRQGRLPVFISTFSVMFVMALFQAFSPNFAFLLLTRALCGTAGSGAVIVMYVLVSEFVTSERQAAVGTVFNASWALSSCIMAPLAWLLRDSSWRYLTIALWAPGILAFVLYYWLRESPRWLSVKGKTSQAKNVLDKVGEVNGFCLPGNVLVQSAESSGSSRKLVDVLRGGMGVKAVIMGILWANCSFVYYGLSFNPQATKKSNVYVSFFLVSLVEAPGYMAAGMGCNWIGRRWTLLGSFALAGVCLTAMPFFENVWVVQFLQMGGKFFTSGSFNVVYIYTPELFPTSIRSSAMGFCSSMSRLGGMSAPLMNVAIFGIFEPLFGDADFPHLLVLPYFAFGITSIAASLLTLALPETLGSSLPDAVAASAEHILSGSDDDARSDGYNENPIGPGNIEMSSPRATA